MVDAKSFVAKNPLVLPAAILAAVFYCGLLKADFENPPRSLFPKERISAVFGTVASSPSKIGGAKNAYLVKVRLKSVREKSGGQSDACGTAEVFVPAKLYEIFSPGKMYSAWSGKKNSFLIDIGAEVEFEVVPKSFFDKKTGAKRTQFNATSIAKCEWEEKWDRVLKEKRPPKSERNFFLRAKIFFLKAVSKVQKARALSRLHFSRLMYAWGSAGGLVLALLSGSREYLEGDVRNAFRDAGLSHILALSGMHLSLFSGLAFFVGKKSFGKKYAPLLELFAVVFFFWFAGKSPSLFRALLFSLCALCGAAFKMKAKNALNTLAFCFLLHACVFPADLREAAFVLSYAALLGILLLQQFFSKVMCKKIPARAGESVGTSLSAQIFTGPISLKIFGVFAPAGVFASVVVSPLVTIFVYAALAFVLICLLCPFFAPFCGGVLKAFYFVLEKCVLAFASFPKIST